MTFPNDLTVSVVIPLLRGREADLAGLAAWTRQTLSDARVEVVAVSPGEKSGDGAALRLLRDCDRLLVEEGMGEAALWDAGARAASGEVLVLTECHVVPLPGCLSAALAALRNGFDVACFESCAPQSTAAAWLEDAVYQDLFDRYIDAGDPRALSLRGVALSREIYLRAGGLRPSDNECFAERVLAARLAKAGARFGRATGAVVEHVPNNTFQRLRKDNLDFHRDAICARVAGATVDVDPDLHLEPTPEWNTRGRFHPALNRTALPAIARLAVHRGGPARAARRALLCALVNGALGPRLAALATEFRSRLAECAFNIAWRRGRRPDPFSLWLLISQASVLRILSERSVTGAWARALQLRADGEAIGSERLSAYATGLHQTERYDGKAFRWTEPVVVFDVRLPPEATAITLELLGIVPVRTDDVSVAWGSRRVAQSALCVDGAAIKVSAPKGVDGPLTVAVRPFRSEGDRRRLGLPLVSIAALS